MSTPDQRADFREEEKLGKGYDAALMRRLLVYLKPYGGYMIIATALLTIASLTQLIGPYLVKVAIDDYIAHGDYVGLRNIALFYFLFLMFQMAVGYGQTYIMQWIGQRAMYDLRLQVFDHVQSMHLGFYDKNPTGRLLTRVTSDVNAMQETFSSGTIDVIGNLLQVVGILVAMFVISARLSLVTFIILPLLIGATIVFRIYIRAAYRQVRLLVARLNAYTQEHLGGINEVQLFVQEKKTFRRFAEINRDLASAHQKTVIIHAVFFPAVELIGAISLALILWYGGGNVVQGAVTIGTLAAFIQYVERFYRPIRDLADQYNILQSAMAASERIFKLLDTKPEIAIPLTPAALDGFSGAIEFEKVCFAYSEGNDVLHHIDFRVSPGEKVALVGATGSGKSSTVSLICRFYEYREGAVRFDSLDLRKLDPQVVRSQIGLVLQDVFLFSGSIAENITLGNQEIKTEKVRLAAAQVGLMPFIEKLKDGFDHQVGERGTSLSLGQRQLISFARALAYDPKVLILDEATSSVDNETEQIIVQALKRMFRGRTSIIVAHRLSTIKEADKILVFHKGKIVEQGKHEELLQSRGIYWRLYQLQYQDQEVV